MCAMGNVMIVQRMENHMVVCPLMQKELPVKHVQGILPMAVIACRIVMKREVILFLMAFVMRAIRRSVIGWTLIKKKQRAPLVPSVKL